MNRCLSTIFPHAAKKYLMCRLRKLQYHTVVLPCPTTTEETYRTVITDFLQSLNKTRQYKITHSYRVGLWLPNVRELIVSRDIDSTCSL